MIKSDDIPPSSKSKKEDMKKHTKKSTMTHPDNVDEETPTKKVAKVCVKRSPADNQDPMEVTGSDTQTKKTSKRKVTKYTEGVKTIKSRRFEM